MEHKYHTVSHLSVKVMPRFDPAFRGHVARLDAPAILILTYTQPLRWSLAI